MEFITKRIFELADVVGGGTPSTSNECYWGGDIPWISPADLTGYQSVYISHGKKFITSEGVEKSGTQKLPEGTVLFSSRAPIGYIAIAQNAIYTNQGFKSLICKPQMISNLYLYYYLKLNLDYIKNFASGSTFPELSARRLKSIKVTFCKSIQVQQRIASILSAYDSQIENNQKRIKLLEQMAENLYKEWFVRFRFPGYENAEFEGGIPRGWIISCLSNYGRIETGKTPSMEHQEYYGDKYLFVKTPDMHNNVFVLDTEENLSEQGNKIQPKKLLPENSIMVSCIGSAGVVAINAKLAHTNQQINSIVLDDSKNLEWLYHTCKFLKPTIELFGATGATMTNLSKGKFEKLKIVEPTMEFREKYHKICHPIFSTIRNLQENNIALAHQRDLLLPRLMSGKLSV